MQQLLNEWRRFLTERNKNLPNIMYHGTSSRFLKSILSNGLDPDPRKRVWQDDKDAMTSMSQVTRKSVGGIYLAANFGTAYSSATNAVDKFGGHRVIIEVQIQSQSAYGDEDSVTFSINHAMKGVVEKLNMRSANADFAYIFGYYIASTDAEQRKIINMFADELMERLGQKYDDKILSKIPISYEIIKNLAESLMWMNCVKYVIINRGLRPRSVYQGARHAIESTKQRPEYEYNDVRWEEWGKEIGEKADEIVNNIDYYDYKGAEADYLDALDKLTRRYRVVLANPKYISDDFWESNLTVRVMTPVGFRGSNKIVSIVLLPRRGGKEKIIYGTPSEQMMDNVQDWIYEETTQDGLEMLLAEWRNHINEKVL